MHRVQDMTKNFQRS